MLSAALLDMLPVGVLVLNRQANGAALIGSVLLRDAIICGVYCYGERQR